MRIISIANQKSGCGKTTTAVNLGAALALRGKRTAVIDMDPQAHATLTLGRKPEGLTTTVYELLTQVHAPVCDAIAETKTDLLEVVPCNIQLAGAELQLNLTLGREFVLGEKLKSMDEHYDFCIIDCPPSLGMLTLNALVASSDVIVPVQVHYHAMEGLRQLLDTVTIVSSRFQPCNVRVLGLLLTFVEEQTTLSRQLQQQMRDYFGSLVFETVIHRSIRLAEAPIAGESVLMYAPESKVAAEYTALAAEIINGGASVATTGRMVLPEEVTYGRLY
jgi:chromosome partitioning protein